MKSTFSERSDQLRGMIRKNLQVNWHATANILTAFRYKCTQTLMKMPVHDFNQFIHVFTKDNNFSSLWVKTKFHSKIVIKCWFWSRTVSFPKNCLQRLRLEPCRSVRIGFICVLFLLWFVRVVVSVRHCALLCCSRSGTWSSSVKLVCVCIWHELLQTNSDKLLRRAQSLLKSHQTQTGLPNSNSITSITTFNSRNRHMQINTRHNNILAVNASKWTSRVMRKVCWNPSISPSNSNWSAKFQLNHLAVPMTGTSSIDSSLSSSTTLSLQGPDLQNILRQSYDYPKLRSTYDKRLIHKTSYKGREAFVRYSSLAKS